MKKEKEAIETKFCSLCYRTFPLTDEYWRRSSIARDGFYHQCKNCQDRAAQYHYRNIISYDAIERGVVGVKCILWSPKCSVCPCVSENDLSACWRLANTKNR